MSTNKTPNLQLHAWEPTDGFSRAEFNDNFAKLDAAHGEVETALAEKPTMYRRYHNGLDRCGKDNPSEAPFPEPPKLVLIFDMTNGKYIMWSAGLKLMLSPFFPNSPCTAEYTSRLNHEDGTSTWYLRWYSDTPEHQFDEITKTYFIVSFY